jgi:hypothetical protein
MLTPAELAHRVGAKQVGNEYVCLCAVHEADGGRHKPSCAIAGGTDHPIVIICRSRGCDWKDILTPWGIPVAEVMNGNAAKAAAGAPTYYTYTDDQGRVLYRKKRTASKDFFFEQSDGCGGWIASKAQNDGRPVMDRVLRHIYRRHELAGKTELFLHRRGEGCRPALGARPACDHERRRGEALD